MSEDKLEEAEAEEEKKGAEAIDEDEEESSRVVHLDEEDELDEDEFDEDEEVDEIEKVEEKPETSAVFVLGQGDLMTVQANRGADDPGDNTLSEPQFMCKYGDMLFVSDRGNHRALIWNQAPEEVGEPASIVLGQEDFSDCLENQGITTTLDEMTSGLGDESLDGFTISKAQESTLSGPSGIAVIDGKLYISDSGNHRVLRWAGLPTEDAEEPSLVLGQDNMEDNEANRRGFVGSGSLFFPMGIRSGDDQHVFVADKDNHRILFWKKIPFNNGWNADICLGQTSMDEREPNRGEFDVCGPDTLSFPTSLFYDVEGDKFFVVDQGNNRVLIWNKLPNQNGQTPDLVLGQKDFYSRSVNAGLGSRRACPEGLFFPTDVVFGPKGLFVSDSGNHRVLVWKEFPTENGQPADVVIGQKDFFENAYNRNGKPSASTLNDPYGLFLEQDPEDEEDEGKLYICDRGNSRIVVWEELPEPPKSEEEEDDALLDEMNFEEDELMGDDDDFLEEEEEETPPDEVPSV